MSVPGGGVIAIQIIFLIVFDYRRPPRLEMLLVLLLILPLLRNFRNRRIGGMSYHTIISTDPRRCQPGKPTTAPIALDNLFLNLNSLIMGLLYFL